MSRVLYISKLNLVSHHIYDVYKNKEVLKNILTKVLIRINNKYTYERIDTKNINGKDKITYKANYEFSSIEKIEESIIVGNLLKTSDLYYNTKKDDTDELEKNKVEFTESINFYFDVFKEKVIFYTKSRFGYEEFNIAFTHLINHYVNLENNEDYIFEVETIKQDTNIETIQNELKQMGSIKQLKITIKPPNPDDPLLDEIESNIEGYLKDIEEGNITSTSSLFNSTAPEGLKIDSKIVINEFEKINKIHSKLSDEVAFKNNYTIVEAESRSGRRYSTHDKKPLTSKIKDYQTDGPEFIKVCKNLIDS